MDPADSVWRNGAKSHLYPGNMSKCSLKGNFLYFCSKVKKMFSSSNGPINKTDKSKGKVTKFISLSMVLFMYCSTQISMYVCVLTKAALLKDVVQKIFDVSGFFVLN